MAVLEWDQAPDPDDDPDVMAVGVLGDALVARRAWLDAGEAEWLAWLAAFDRRGGFVADGQVCCVSWLVQRCRLARATAHDKLRVARQLAGRGVLAAAYVSGDLSYSQLRALTRITDVDADTDRALVDAAKACTVADLERLVQQWRHLGDQERGDDALARWEKRGLRYQQRFDGLTEITVVVDPDIAARLMACLDATVRYRRQTSEQSSAEDTTGTISDDELASSGEVSSAEDSTTPGSEHRAVRGDLSSAEDTTTTISGEPDRTSEDLSSAEDSPDPTVRPTWAQRRVDALCELVELGVAGLDSAGELDSTRAVVEVLVDYDTLIERHPGGVCELAGGQPLTGEAARRLACDAGIVRAITRGASEVLDLGRQSRDWNTAQRRAIRARHGHRCAISGCERRITEIHHLDPWSNGGATDLALGVALCFGHHRLVHDGAWHISYNPSTGVTTLTGPNGRTLTSPSPPRLPKAA